MEKLGEAIIKCKSYLPEYLYNDLINAFENNNIDEANIYQCNCNINDTCYNCIYDTMERFIQCKKFTNLVKIFPEFEIFSLKRKYGKLLPTNFKPFHIQFNPNEYQISDMKIEDIYKYLRIFKLLLKHNMNNDIRNICEKDSTDLLILYIAFYNYIIKIKSYKYEGNYDYNYLIGMLNDLFENKENLNYFPPIYTELIKDETFIKISKYFDCDIDTIKNPLKKWCEIF